MTENSILFINIACYAISLFIDLFMFNLFMQFGLLVICWHEQTTPVFNNCVCVQYMNMRHIHTCIDKACTYACMSYQIRICHL